MSAQYPVAANADAALSAPIGRAIRELEARRVAGRDVEFVTETVGAAFETREMAQSAYQRHLDEGGRICQLTPVAAETRKGRRPAPAPVEPIFEEGRRWPTAPETPVKMVWRLSISYWRPVDPQRFAALEQARAARRRADNDVLSVQALRALAGQPLRPVRPQQPLDVGLFETRLPENEGIVIPDE